MISFFSFRLVMGVGLAVALSFSSLGCAVRAPQAAVGLGVGPLGEESRATLRRLGISEVGALPIAHRLRALTPPPSPLIITGDGLDLRILQSSGAFRIESRVHGETGWRTLTDLTPYLPSYNGLLLQRLAITPRGTLIALIVAEPGGTAEEILVLHPTTNSVRRFSLPNIASFAWIGESHLLITQSPQGRPSSASRMNISTGEVSEIARLRDPLALFRVSEVPGEEAALLTVELPNEQFAIRVTADGHAPLPTPEGLTKLLCHGPSGTVVVRRTPDGGEEVIRMGQTLGGDVLRKLTAPRHISELRCIGDTFFLTERDEIRESLLWYSKRKQIEELTSCERANCSRSIAPHLGPSPFPLTLLHESFEEPPKRLRISSPTDFPRPSPGRARRLVAHAVDGTPVPLTLVSRAPVGPSFRSPVLLTTYQSYGATLEPRYSPLHSVLLDHGVALAFCHGRGGGYYGPTWHEAARAANRAKGVDDLAACIEHLRQLGARRIILATRSGGAVVTSGLLLRGSPQIDGVLLDVPFLNLEAGLRNEADPFLARERYEWGNPDSPKELAVLRTVSLADAESLPPTLVILRPHDERIPIEETLERIARLRSRSHTSPVSMLRELRGLADEVSGELRVPPEDGGSSELHQELLLFAEGAGGHSDALSQMEIVKEDAVAGTFILALAFPRDESTGNPEKEHTSLKVTP